MDQPVLAFVSYAREDKEYCDELIKHTRPLCRDGEIKIWNDGEIIVGSEWNAELRSQLENADIFVFLLTADSAASDFINEVEFPLARRSVERRNARIIPILVSEFDVESMFGKMMKQWQMLPRDGTPIRERNRRSAPWAKIVPEIRKVIKDIRANHPCEEITNPIFNLRPESETAAGKVGSGLSDVSTVQNFWESIEDLKRAQKVISVEGTLSQFAPLLGGPPKAKARMHRDFRDLADVIQREKSSSVHACLSITAGQMVSRYDDGSSDYVYFGLYNSIVRNSIPVYVSRDYLENAATEHFANGRRTMEARVVGRLARTDNRYVLDYLERYGLIDYFRETTLDLWHNAAFCLIVDGNGTGIECIDKEPRYLDGDIWFAVKPTKGGKNVEYFETSFLNISDKSAREAETLDLLRKIERRHGDGYSIVAQYDKFEDIDSIINVRFMQEPPSPID